MLLARFAEADLHGCDGVGRAIVAAALICESLWAAPFALAPRRTGAQLVTAGHIPIQPIIAAVEADAELEAEGA